MDLMSKPKELYKYRSCDFSAIVQRWNFDSSVDATLQSNFQVAQCRAVLLRDLPHIRSDYAKKTARTLALIKGNVSR